MAHLNLDVNYPSHPKTVRLVGLLGRGADVLPVRLWCYVGKYHAIDGRLTDYTEQEIETLVAWWGKPRAMVKAMLSVGFLERRPDGIYVHDWLDMQGHIHAFSVRGRAAAQARWAKSRDSPSNAASMPQACGEQYPCLAGLGPAVFGNGKKKKRPTASEETRQRLASEHPEEGAHETE